MEPKVEQLNLNSLSYTFNSDEEALKVWEGISDTVKYGMAKVYQKAFGGDPWFEVGTCQSCGSFTQSISACTSCQSIDVTEAYPVQTLVNEYFPVKMMQAYLPGMLSLVMEVDQVIGFTAGGFIELSQLVTNKYEGNETILKSIMQETGLSDSSILFYDNETCVDSDYQGRGVGKILGARRLADAQAMNANLICGRTVNQPWLQLKQRQLSANGFDFISFVPEADDYQINNLERYFYLALK